MGKDYHRSMSRRNRYVMLVVGGILLALVLSFFVGKQVARRRNAAHREALAVEALADHHSPRQKVVNDLIDGRIALRVAAALLKDLHTEEPAWPFFLENFEGDTEEERACRYAIELVHVSLAGDPRQEEIVARLERELEAGR